MQARFFQRAAAVRLAVRSLIAAPARFRVAWGGFRGVGARTVSHRQAECLATWVMGGWLIATGLAGLAQEAAQFPSGVVEGRVISTWDAEPLAGVAVSVRGTTLATVTDAEGRYRLVGVPPGRHTLVFARSGFVRTLVTDVLVAEGQTSRVEANLRPEFLEREEYVVTAAEMNEQTTRLLLERKEAASVMDTVGADFLSRVGVNDAAEAVSKVTGVTVVDGRFAVIRGLSDRYTSATLNGGEIPSADPYRKAVQLDLFPAEMISQVSIQKTFTPDQPGGFTGGSIDLRTKAFPERFSFKSSGGASYNSQATFNDRYLSYSGGSRDWTGMDDGSRAEPEALARIPNPAALPVAFPATPEGLAAAQGYRDLLRSFPSRELGGRAGEAPPLNHSGSFSLGDTFEWWNRRFGWFLAASYDRKFQHYEGRQQRYSWPIVPAGTSPQEANMRADLQDTRSTMEVAWGSLANVAVELLPGHTVGFTFLYSQNADDVTRLRIGPASLANLTEGNTAYLNELHWTERNLQTYQWRGEHSFTRLWDLETRWLVSLSTTTQDEPDYRLFNFIQNPGGTINFAGSSGVPEPSGGPTRYFRHLKEDNTTYKLDFSLPVHLWHAEPARFKWGGYASASERLFRERTYTLRPGQQNFTGNPLTFPNELLSDALLNFEERRHPRTGAVTGYRMFTFFADEMGGSRLDGRQEILAGYGMVELPLVGSWKLVAGARVESTLLEVDSASRLGGSGFNTIEQSDVLPAAGVIWEVVTNMNVRLHFAQTVARPTFREFSRLRSYDVTGDEVFTGNPRLIMSAVDNYDLRWEWFRRPGEVFALGGFYKFVLHPIEKVALDARNNDNISYINSPEAEVYGLELEARTALDWISPMLASWSLGFNAAWIVSEVLNTEQIQATKAEVGLRQKTRPLYDQSPYVVNTDLTWESSRWGTTLTLAFNVAGERLYLVNNAGYDVYEQPAPQLDLFISQRLGKHWRLKFSAKNLLDPDIERTYGKAGEVAGRPWYSKSSRGRSVGFSLSCDF
ncbi:MAG: TonB-dependent receptor [Limisphaera sp.]|nr:TonB-dependent receptor [Limisphaera sp.]